MGNTQKMADRQGRWWLGISGRIRLFVIHMEEFSRLNLNYGLYTLDPDSILQQSITRLHIQKWNEFMSLKKATHLIAFKKQ